MFNFYEFWRYVVKVFNCWKKMDVIRDFFINQKKKQINFNINSSIVYSKIMQPTRF